MKPVLFRDSRIFRIHIVTSGFRFWKPTVFRNSEGLEGLKECAPNGMLRCYTTNIKVQCDSNNVSIVVVKPQLTLK